MILEELDSMISNGRAVTLSLVRRALLAEFNGRATFDAAIARLAYLELVEMAYTEGYEPGVRRIRQNDTGMSSS